MIFWAWVRFQLLLWALRRPAGCCRLASPPSLLVAAAPVTVVAAAGLAGAWLRGWPPARLRRAAAWSPAHDRRLPARSRPSQARTRARRVGAARTRLAARLARLQPRGDGSASVLTAPVAVPAGLAGGGAVGAADLRDRDRPVRPHRHRPGDLRRPAVAPRRPHRPGADHGARPVPADHRDGRIVMGATIRAVGHRWQPVLAVPYAAMGRHQVIIGSSGSGKTNLMIRTWAGWYAAARRAARPGRPGRCWWCWTARAAPTPGSRPTAPAALLHAAGAGRVAIWPDDAAVSLWALPPPSWP